MKTLIKSRIGIYLLIITIFFLMFPISCKKESNTDQSPAPVWQWAAQAGSGGSDMGNSIAVDRLGNTYIRVF